MTESKTTTVETTQTVEIPTVDQRKLETFWLVQNTVGEVTAIHAEKRDAEAALRQQAKGRSGDENPRLFLVQSQGVPTDHCLANRKSS